MNPSDTAHLAPAYEPPKPAHATPTVLIEIIKGRPSIGYRTCVPGEQVEADCETAGHLVATGFARLAGPGNHAFDEFHRKYRKIDERENPEKYRPAPPPAAPRPLLHPVAVEVTDAGGQAYGVFFGNRTYSTGERFEVEREFAITWVSRGFARVVGEVDDYTAALIVEESQRQQAFRAANARPPQPDYQAQLREINRCESDSEGPAPSKVKAPTGRARSSA